jgi:hypothetical protein
MGRGRAARTQAEQEGPPVPGLLGSVGGGHARGGRASRVRLRPVALPWLLIDLDPLFVAPEGVPDHVNDEMKQLALRAFRECTTVDEWIYAFDEPELGAGPTYRFWPHRSVVEEFVPWPVSFFPNGDDQAFVSQDFAWGSTPTRRTRRCTTGRSMYLVSHSLTRSSAAGLGPGRTCSIRRVKSRARYCSEASTSNSRSSIRRSREVVALHPSGGQERPGQRR